MAAATACPSAEEVAAFVSGARAAVDGGGLEAHLADCPSCRAAANRVISTGETRLAPAAGATTTAASLGGEAGAQAVLARGTILDRYVVLDRVGAGGMGVVYAAYDAELDRKLAVKLLQPGRKAAGSEGRTRLMREAQAMARLSHENVIAVYDVGTVESQVFVAMEYVDGTTLSEWMRERSRSPAEVIEKLLPAGRALAAAHAAGIVHRDFKPDNVMVGKDGRVRVLDFGLARAAQEAAEGTTATSPPMVGAALATPLTRSGSLLGTPLYMSPEQWRNQPADARSDQFSYCVALYEALWGVRPFDGETVAELAAAVLHGVVRTPPPERRVPAWIEQIVRRGLSTAPEARWPSVDQLLEALAADPDAVKQRRRRARLVAGAFAALAVVATFGLVRSTRAGAQRCRGLESRLAGVWDPARRAAIRAAFVASGKPYGADTADRVARLFDGYTQAWVKTRTDACEATHLHGDQSERLLDLRVACLDRRLHELASMTQLFSGAADGQVVDKAVAAASQLTSLDGCSDAAALQSVVPPPDEPARRQKVEALRARLAEARALENAGQYDRGLVIAREVDDAAAPLAYAPLRAESLYRRGSLEEKKGDAKNAEQRYDQALQLAAEGHDDVLVARIWPALLVAVGQDQARFADAMLLTPVAESAILRAGDDHDARAAFSDVAGRMYGAQGRPADAQRMFERSLAVRQKSLPPDDPAIAASLNNLGIATDEQGKYEEALALYQRALAIREKAFGPGHPLVASTLNNIGIVYKEEGRYDEARRMYERALDIHRNALGAEHPSVGEDLNNLGNVLQRQGRYDEARRLHEQALALRERLFGPMHPIVASSLQNLAVVLSSLHRLDEAQRIYERTLDIRLKTLGPDHPLTGSTVENIGDVLAARGRFADAARQHQRALAILEKANGPKHPDLAFPLTGLAIDEVELGRNREAAVAAERALALREATQSERQDLADTRFVLARALWGSGGDRARALKLARQARDDFATAPARRESSAEVDRWLRAHPPR